jgi:CHAD domain-containing protein
MKKADMRAYAKAVVSENCDGLLNEWERVRDSRDVDALHRMRVSSRRLRAALRIFRWVFSKEKFRATKKSIRKIGRALGVARELDIQMRFLASERQRAQGSLLRSEMTALLHLFTKDREAAQKRIVAVLGDQKVRENLKMLRSSVGNFPGEQEGDAEEAFQARKKEVVLRQLADLEAYRTIAYRPKCIHELHRMRIAAKNLRYTLEIIRPFYGRSMESGVRAALHIQNILGELHEYDVWLEFVAGLKGHKGVAAAVSTLEGTCVALRAVAYQKFIRIWKHLQRRDVWKKLKKMV